MVTFRYQSELADALAARNPGRQRWQLTVSPRDHAFGIILSILGPLATLIYLAIHLLGQRHLTRADLGWMAACGTYLSVGWLSGISMLQRVRRFRRLADLTGSTTVTLDEGGISVSVGDVPQRFERWDRFDRVVETPQHLFLHRYGRRREWLILPVRGLADRSELAVARDLIAARVEAATRGFPVGIVGWSPMFGNR